MTTSEARSRLVTVLEDGGMARSVAETVVDRITDLFRAEMLEEFNARLGERH